VEPAIFGTLLERALDPDERHKLGAHYTPRAYVERLVLPTVIEPLREDWNDRPGCCPHPCAPKARRILRWPRSPRFISACAQCACSIRPAAAGNFLYVTLEHLKRLEGEVLNLRRTRPQPTRQAAPGWPRARR
jgi:hypothetical protein